MVPSVLWVLAVDMTTDLNRAFERARVRKEEGASVSSSPPAQKVCDRGVCWGGWVGGGRGPQTGLQKEPGGARLQG